MWYCYTQLEAETGTVATLLLYQLVVTHIDYSILFLCEYQEINSNKNIVEGHNILNTLIYFLI